jgi:hypothetical protein
VTSVLAVLTSCAALPEANPSQPAITPDYGRIVARYATGTCHRREVGITPTVDEIKSKDPSIILTPCPLFSAHAAVPYTGYEISDLRWVRSMTGWSWLACVRFRDEFRGYYYALYIRRDNSVTEARLALQIDNCGPQNYVPFDITTGTIGRPTPVELQALH